MKKLVLISTAVISAAMLAFGASSAAQAAVAPVNLSYVVMAHPDDDWMTWGMVQNSPNNYKVFISATRGEQTGFCGAPATGSHPAPVPYPTGKWTQTCEDARMNSWTSFFTKMATTDPTVPGDLKSLGTVGPFPTNGVNLQVDDGAGLVPAATTARVWVDTQGRGAAISFDLGDADLTEAEVKWAIDTVRDNRAAFGINTTLPNYNVLGAYANSGYGNCALYAHPDHKAVHAALWNNKLGVAYRAAATCASDPDAARTHVVAEPYVSTAWGAGGAFKTAYGWLGGYILSNDQSSIFMKTQSFWQRW